MQTEDLSHILIEQKAIASRYLNRYVIVDCYLPKNIAHPSSLSLLLINDGQDLEDMPFDSLLNDLHANDTISPLFCVGIHANKYRRMEYGTAAMPDYEGRGAKAKAFQAFVLEELLPFLKQAYAIPSFLQQAYCGFSLGGLCAVDAVFHHPESFSTAGVFSGSLWWRSKELGPDYNDETDRIMHQLVRQGSHHPGQRYYFMTGSLDETADRNNNGIIDSIDDTLDLIGELKTKGWTDDDICYINYSDGRHDVPTWGRAFPHFLEWGWGKKKEDMAK
jgi:iron(III)-enterobactin esterase